jgi:methyltransferase (TIGR00027 family)
VLNDSTQDKHTTADEEGAARKSWTDEIPVSDAMLLSAMSRARESERYDALFYDPFARRLAGARGEELALAYPSRKRVDWAEGTITRLVDDLIAQQVANGVDTVVSVGAGLDSRPYRMNLPSGLKWVEIDLAENIAHKETVLRNDVPRCSLDRIAIDRSDAKASCRKTLAELGQRPMKALIVTRGLLMYMTRETVAELAEDLRSFPSYDSWILDLVSPRMFKSMRRRSSRTGIPATLLRFAPEDGPRFFEKFGWNPREEYSIFHEAVRLKRLPRVLRPLAWMTDTKGKSRSRVYGAICLLSRSG